MNDVRQYVQNQITSVDSELEAWREDLLGNNDITEAQATRFYNLFFGVTTTEKQGQDNFIDTIPMVIDIYSIVANNEIVRHDELYDKARLIRNNIIKKESIFNAFGNCVLEILPISITPSEEDSNDNVIKMQLNFNIRHSYKV